jgi:hypothetical protein
VAIAALRHETRQQPQFTGIGARLRQSAAGDLSRCWSADHCAQPQWIAVARSKRQGFQVRRVRSAAFEPFFITKAARKE